MIDEAIYELTKIKLKNYKELKNKKITYDKVFNIIIKVLREIDKY